MKKLSMAAVLVFAVVATSSDDAHAVAPVLLQSPPGTSGFHVSVDATQIHAHVLTPPAILMGTSEKGPNEVIVQQKRPTSAPNPRFDSVLFANTLHAALKTNVAGYVMQARQNGATSATMIWNWSQTPADAGNGWTVGTRMHVASLSKMVTAIAMTKVLDAHGIPYTTPITTYLPSYWAQGPNVSAITFANLLTHTSGFNSNGQSRSDYPFMKQMVAQGVPLATPADNNVGLGGTPHYENMNFGLCRILLAVIDGDVERTAQSATDLDSWWDVTTTTAYANYAQQNIFTPAGVTDATLVHTPDAALGYPFPVVGKGMNSGDMTTMAGAAGWHLSLTDLLSVMGTARRAGTILSTTEAQTMLGSSFGIDWTVSLPDGSMYCKNGMWTVNSETEQGVACYLPNNFELVTLVNSVIGGSPSFLYTLVSNAVISSYH